MAQNYLRFTSSKNIDAQLYVIAANDWWEAQFGVALMGREYPKNDVRGNWIVVYVASPLVRPDNAEPVAEPAHMVQLRLGAKIVAEGDLELP